LFFHALLLPADESVVWHLQQGDVGHLAERLDDYRIFVGVRDQVGQMILTGVCWGMVSM